MAGLHIPNILLAIPRNPVTAVGLPLALGFLSGSPASKVANKFSFASWETPREVFPYVWTLLYIAMGYASHIAVKSLDSSDFSENRSDISLGLALYYGQLGLNCLWSPLFFGGRSVTLALADSILLTGTAFYMTVRLIFVLRFREASD
ncbi:hypothetical protein NP233_g4555 [Leucocoprinus birnbaumii]|uniref:Uncharacterized protein n=1 Tax=Leucocoprinus birnbaumii TaxID=56174 RepID=A0AAD5W0W8_9AGAR|nr:hypothetical protein NP233_g4555 [Leucocoprinus birnbaumii]